MRPKGRGRPQRILTGSWPEDHVHGVIRAVVFRDPSSLPRHIDREDASKLTANRSSGSSMSRLLTVHPAHQQSIQVFSPLILHFVWLLATSVFLKYISKQGELGGGSGSGMRGLIHTAMNNGNGHNYNHEFALPSASNTTGTFTHGTVLRTFSRFCQHYCLCQVKVLNYCLINFDIVFRRITIIRRICLSVDAFDSWPIVCH